MKTDMSAFFFSTSVLNSKCFSIYKDALQIHFWQSKNGKKTKKTRTNVGRNLIVFEDKLSSLSPRVNLQELCALFSAGFVVCRALRSQPHSHTRNTVPEWKLHIELYDYVISDLRHLQIFVSSCTITTKEH